MFNVVLYVARNADSMVVGRMLGSAALGVYSMAYRLMLFPLQNMTFIVARVLFPIMSRKHESTAEVAALYLRALGFIAFLSAPLMAGLFALREPFVHVMLGARWQDSVALLGWLAPVGFIQSLVSSTGTVLMARGSTGLMLRLGLVGAARQVGAVVLGARWGLEGVAAAYLAANVVNAVPALYFSARLIGIGFGALVRAIAPAMAAALFMVAVLGASAPLLAQAIHGALPVLLLQVAVGVIAYGAASLVMLRAQLASLGSLVGFQKKAEA
jgi:PST family polysaccharide transporter